MFITGFSQSLELKVSWKVISDSYKIFWVVEMTMILLSEIGLLQSRSNSWVNEGYDFDLGFVLEVLKYQSHRFIRYINV